MERHPPHAADISKAKRHLGWEPEVPVFEGLRHTADWHLRAAIPLRAAS